jgi:ParB family transcriptional regulator, chromosome partitioning protein
MLDIETTLTARPATRQVRRIPIGQIIPDPTQPRGVFDQNEIAELSASIVQRGLAQPITVRPLKSEAFTKTQYMIVAGERRWRAHLHAELADIECIVRSDMTGGIETHILQTIENVMRVDMTPLEEARAFDKMQQGGMTIISISQQLGFKNTKRVSERLTLLRLSEHNQQLVAMGCLHPAMATLIGMAPAEHHDRLIAKVRDGKLTNAEQMRSAVIAIKEASQGQQPLPLADTPATTADVQAATRLEKRIEQIQQITQEGFKDGECVAMLRVSPERAEEMAERLALTRAAMLLMERELRRVLAAGTIASSGTLSLN